jgi:threonine/homoserine/homoserine lactone efflux protein
MLVVLAVPGAVPGLALFAVVRSAVSLGRRSRKASARTPASCVTSE